MRTEEASMGNSSQDAGGRLRQCKRQTVQLASQLPDAFGSASPLRMTRRSAATSVSSIGTARD
jgi:hypothetical protein